MKRNDEFVVERLRSTVTRYLGADANVGMRLAIVTDCQTACSRLVVEGVIDDFGIVFTKRKEHLLVWYSFPDGGNSVFRVALALIDRTGAPRRPGRMGRRRPLGS